MFERFTERARHVVVLAQEESRGLRHSYIGTEHILLGLMREEEGMAARVLDSLGVTVEGVREQIVLVVGRGTDPPGGAIPFTARAKRVLETALQESLLLGHNYIGTEHMLLGVVGGADEGVAVRILAELGADREKVRDAMMRMISGPGARGRAPGEGPATVRPMPRIHREWHPGVDRFLGQLEGDIRERLGREPDLGDLLLIVASVPGSLSADALRELGIEPDSLRDAIERLRHDKSRPPAQPIGPDALEVIRRRLGIPRAPGDKPA